MRLTYRWFARYALAPAAVAAGLLMRLALTRWAGPGLPTYITFYPAVMLVALAAGCGPGILATVVAALVTDYWIITPLGFFRYETLVDAVGLTLFIGMGVLMSVVASQYRRLRARKQAEEALRTVNTELERRVAAQTAEIRWANQTLEQRVAERTRELQAARESMRAARRAALNLMDDAIAARGQAEQAGAGLRAAHERMVAILASITDAFFVLDRNWRFTYVNPETERLLRKPAAEMLGRNVWELFTGADAFRERYEQAFATGQAVHFEEFYAPLANWFEVNGYPGADGLSVYFRDATARKQAEANQALLTDILRIPNHAGREMHSLIAETLRLIKQSTGFDAVGLRLRDGDDCPYYEQNGLSDEFVREENYLCARGGDGAIVRDADGRPVLECTCGLVFSGRTDPGMPFFTEGGSFWTNTSSELLALAPESDPRKNPRNRCIHAGYQSVALVPVRSGDEIIGLLQLNDRREGRFTPESILFFESLAGNMGLAFKRKQAEDALRKSREDLKRAQAVARTGSWRLDLRKNEMLWSEEARRIFGVPEGTRMSHETFLNAVHPDDRAFVREKWLAGLRGEPHDIEHRIVVGDTVKWVRERAELEHDENGVLVGRFGTTQDITELKRAEEAVRNIALFPEQDPAPVLRVEADGRLQYANPSAEALLRQWKVGMGDAVPYSLASAASGALSSGALREVEFEVGDRLISFMLAPIPERGYVNLYGRDVTELKQAQEREQEAFAFVTASRAAVDILEAMGEGVLLLDMKGRITSVNPALSKMIGVPVGETIGRPVRSFLPMILPPEDRGKADAALAKALRGHSASLPSLTLLSRDGRRIPTIPTVSFVRGADNRPSAIVVTLRDISEMRAMQKSLEESNSLLERIFDDTHLCIACLDTAFNFVRVNRAYADACRHEPAFFQGKNHFALYPHEENEAIFRRVVETGELFSVQEKPFDFPDHPEWGVSYWDWTLQPLRHKQRGMEGLLFCLLDVTQRVRARQGLVESERKYRELVENANSIILRITPDHRIAFFNEYAQQFFGYKAEEVLGRHVVGTIAPEADSEGRDMREMVREVIASPDLYATNENENVCKDGRRVWVHWANRAVRDDQGRVLEILCVGTDITERRRMEAENQIYQERLRELAEQLAASEEHERWQISRYVHDTIIQNLSLSSMKLGAMQRPLAEAGLDPEILNLRTTRKLVDDAIAECRLVMSELTPALLYELGLVSALSELAEKLQQQHGIRICVEEEGASQPMNAALRGLLFQSTRELMMNALKHAGKCEIRVAVEHHDGEILVRVEDDGGGFDPAGSDLMKEGSGAFGLFSVRERIVGLGGRLDIESAPGRGTRATIRVPVIVPG